jgi:exodeoxyribonuclease V beta subunit
MIADLGSEQFERRRAQALTEELAEDLRVLYVAVTRAKFRCYLAWADARTENTPNASALAWLLEFADAGFSGQQEKFKTLCAANPETFAFKLLPVSCGIGQIYRKSATAQTLQAKSRQRSLHTPWQMSSYTALSALSLNDAPELPADKAGEIQATMEPSSTLLPRGANTGNVVHELLEKNSCADLAQRKDISQQRNQACRRYGLMLERPEVIDELLRAVVATPLSKTDSSFCLMNLEEKRCLKEMPFYLSMRTMDAAYINRILQDTPAFQPLSAKQLSGYLTGFIDLICEHQGRYYVMDYKTNDLGDYEPQTLTEAMREHNYGLQYWLYTVVLHRYLAQRLQDYRYDSHFGGVRYLFVRGMRPDMPMSGVYQDRPDLAKVEALARLFGG